VTEGDAVLVRVLAAIDALNLPIREWTHNAPSNRRHGLKLAGVPFRAQARGDETGRKASEQLITALARKKLLRVSRSTRVRFPLLKLTEAGEIRARAIVGLPGRADGRAFLALVAEIGSRVKELTIGTCEGRWVREIDLNGGHGWGDTKGRRLGLIELEFLPAGFRGWVKAHSDIRGHAGYTATPAGLAELNEESPAPEMELPDEEPEAVEVYRTEQDARLRAIASDPPAAAGELGFLPLPVSPFVMEPTCTS
jgi:hypothetical protein